MYTYKMLSDTELETITKEHLTSMYNDAVETIWHLYHRIDELQEENDAVWASYDEISYKLYD